MRILTVATATWREAVRQPVALIILFLSALLIYVSQFLNFYHFDEQTSFNIIRQMAVAQTLICGIVLAVFTASAVLADEIESRTMVTLLVKPVRRFEVIFGKFFGIMAAVGAAFAVLAIISLGTAWWTELKLEKWQVNPALVAVDLPALTTGESSLQIGRSYAGLMTHRDWKGLHYLYSAGDLRLLASGQGAQLVASSPLAIGVGGAGPPHHVHSEGCGCSAANASQGGQGSGAGQAEPARAGLAGLIVDAGHFLSGTGLLLQAFLLTFMHVMVIAALAVAVSTRLPLVFNAMICMAVFVLGNLSETLGRMLLEAPTGFLAQALSAPVMAVCYLLPNFENFDLSQVLSVGGAQVSPAFCAYGVLYGILYTGFLLLLAVFLFERREVA